jgi:integrase
MKKTRGLGFLYQPTYVDKRTGERRTAANWWVQYSIRGKRFRESSGSSNQADAVKLLKRRIGAAAQGRPVGPNVERTTFEDLARILLDDYTANGRRSLERVEDAIGHLRGFLGDAFALDITSDRISKYVTWRQKEHAAPATINRELAALRRAFRLAAKAGKVAMRPEISLLREDNRRKGFFEVEQYKAMLENLPDYLRPVVLTAYITGWRIRSEILTRQKHHLDPNAGWLRLEPGETKSGEGRNFPLTPELRDVLLRQLEETRAFELQTGSIVPWLFHRDGKQIGSFRKAWASACKRAGATGKIPHDFRRTAVRNLERAGVPRSAAMAMVGHRTESIYRRYAIADEAMLKEGALKLAALHASDSGPSSATITRIKSRTPDGKKGPSSREWP